MQTPSTETSKIREKSSGRAEASKVGDLMESEPVMISPNATLSEAARKMKEIDCGFLPVGEDNEPAGVITDRDIVIRAIAEGKNPENEKVRDYMTDNVCTCMETDLLEDAADRMNENNVSRLVVVDDGERVTGILTFGRIIREGDNRQETARAVDRAVGKAAA